MVQLSCFIRSGTTRNRTGDTRIFSPLLYQLSYGTIFLRFCVCKGTRIISFPQLFFCFFEKYSCMSEKTRIFALAFRKYPHRNRDVAQLVAHYVRDVGVASSNLVIPTEGSKSATVCCLFRFPHFRIHKMPDCKGHKGRIANKASLHCKQALFVMQGSLVWNVKKPCL